MSLVRAGLKTCVAIDWEDGTPMQFWGNPVSCRLRFPDLPASEVRYLDTELKSFSIDHTYQYAYSLNVCFLFHQIKYENFFYRKRGLYSIHCFGYDERNYAEIIFPVTIFRMPCDVPKVHIPNNQTSWLKWDAVPMIPKSKSYQQVAISEIKCNETVPT